MKKVSDFKVMGEMASKNLDIRMFPTVVSGNLCKAGGEVKMGVNAQTIQDLLRGKVYVALYVMDIEQFDETKRQLESNE